MDRWDDLPDGIVAAGPEGIVDRVNVQASRMLGASRDSLLGLHVRDVLPLDDLQGNRWFDCTDPYDGFASRTALAEQSWFTSGGRELLLTARLHRASPRGPVERLVVAPRC